MNWNIGRWLSGKKSNEKLDASILGRLNQFVTNNKFLIFILSTGFSGTFLWFFTQASSTGLILKEAKVSNSVLIEGNNNIVTVQSKETEKISSKLSVADVSVIDERSIDFKIKNSGNDSAFITGVYFTINDGFCSGCGTPTCNKMSIAYKLYVHELKGESIGKRVILNVGTSRFYFKDLPLTKKSDIITISQAVPPRGVDRFVIEFQFPFIESLEGFHLSCSFIVEPVIIYDGGKKLKTKSLSLSFSKE